LEEAGGVSRHDREFWKRACREVQQGANPAEVAQRIGVRPRTLMWWHWKLGMGRSRRRRAKRAEFLPVVLPEPRVLPIAPAILELETNGIQLRFTPGTDVDYVVALARALRV